jgi:hypothetical protein
LYNFARFDPRDARGHLVLFTKKLRALVKSGKVTASVRIWKTARVKVGGLYRLEEGHIEVTSIREIGWDDLDDRLARDTGFKNLLDLMKIAKHGSGQCVYYIRFRYRFRLGHQHAHLKP